MAEALNHHRGGTGEPLLLIHGIGSMWQVWAPLLPLLEAEREVVAVDLPGFGGSPPLPPGVTPDITALRAALVGLLDELGWQDPHVAGNSLGGWLALELSKIGRARSASALSPAGFWNRWEHRYATTSLRLAQRLLHRLDSRLEQLYARPAFKAAAMAQLVAHPDRIPDEEVVAAARNLARSPGWKPTLDALERESFSGGVRVRPPATIAWGEKDRLLLPRQAERARQLIPQARHITLVGCGHVPTWDDPGLVARAILTSS